MTTENKQKSGKITHIYGEDRPGLVGRGIAADGSGFSNRALELDDNMQVIVKTDDGTVAKPAEPKNKK